MGNGDLILVTVGWQRTDVPSGEVPSEPLFFLFLFVCFVVVVMGTASLRNVL